MITTQEIEERIREYKFKNVRQMINASHYDVMIIRSTVGGPASSDMIDNKLAVLQEILDRIRNMPDGTTLGVDFLI